MTEDQRPPGRLGNEDHPEPWETFPGADDPAPVPADHGRAGLARWLMSEGHTEAARAVLDAVMVDNRRDWYRRCYAERLAHHAGLRSLPVVLPVGAGMFIFFPSDGETPRLDEHAITIAHRRSTP